MERVTVHAHDHMFFPQVPMGGGPDNRLQHFAAGRLVADLSGAKGGDGAALFERGGFYREYASFLDDVAAGRPPSPGFRESRQSVEPAEAIRGRRRDWPGWALRRGGRLPGAPRAGLALTLAREGG